MDELLKSVENPPLDYEEEIEETAVAADVPEVGDQRPNGGAKESTVEVPDSAHLASIASESRRIQEESAVEVPGSAQLATTASESRRVREESAVDVPDSAPLASIASESQRVREETAVDVPDSAQLATTASESRRIRKESNSREVVKSMKRPREAEAGSRPKKRRSGGPVTDQQPGGRRGARSQEVYCPVPWCTQEYQYPKAHVYNFHYPTAVDLNLEMGKKTTQDRLDFVEYLARKLTGRPEASGWQLVDEINTRRLTVPHRMKAIDPTLVAVARQMDRCSRRRYSVPQKMSLCPMNSPALIFHWAVMQEVVAVLDPTENNALMKLFADPARSTELYQRLAKFQTLQDPDVLVVSDDAEEAESGEEARRRETGFADLTIVRPNADQTVEAQVLVREEKAGSLGTAERAGSPKKQCDAFDSHFHMDRVQKRAGVKTWSLEDVEGCRRGAVPEVTIVGGVANFCDPETYPTVEVIQKLNAQGIEVTVGLHPKFAAKASPAVLETLRQLVDLPEVAGLGEIGLDHTTKPEEWPIQRDVLAECLAMLQVRHVLVLHCRDSTPEKKADLLASLFYQTCSVVPKEQRIHLHCFDGSTTDMQRWTRHFPNVYLGFTLKVKERSFGATQMQAVRALKKDRLLLETDAPYFAPQGVQWSTPGCIGATGQAVAELRGEAWEEVMSQSVRNGHRLYQQC